MFVFPMAGLSNRFKIAGYNEPKFSLTVGDNMNLFQASLSGFNKYFESDLFCFIYKQDTVRKTDLLKWLAQIGLRDNRCIFAELSSATMGQAATVIQGLNIIKPDLNEELIIFNIDTIYRNFKKPDLRGSNYLDVSKMEGDQWSFILPVSAGSHDVKFVEEKIRISCLCSVGLYGFRSVSEFYNAYENTYTKEKGKEHYVAPIYNFLITNGISVKYRLIEIENFDFLGTPFDYEQYLIKK